LIGHSPCQSMSNLASYEEIVDFIRSKTDITPQIGIICGSGLGGLSDLLTDTVVVNYADIPGWPVPTVKGHIGELVFGFMHDSVKVVCMRGRFHGYEGHEYHTLGLGVRVMKLLGIQILVVTNAAGGINKNFRVGDMMIINDHVSFPCMSGNNPLVGPNDDKFGTRFPPMSDAYDENLIAHMHNCAAELGFTKIMHEGQYTQVSGPNYESRGEIKMLRMMGADAVGMSTIPEVMVARHCGLKVLALSMITNIAVLPGDNAPPANHKEVIEVVSMRTNDMQNLVKQFCKDAMGVVGGKKVQRTAESIDSKTSDFITGVPFLCIVCAGMVALSRSGRLFNAAIM